MSVRIPEGYKPSEDNEFMNPVMKEYFRQMLVSWKYELLDEIEQVADDIAQSGQLHVPDNIDRASDENNWALELRTRDRMRKLIHKIDAALDRIDRGTYGYCKETGEPIEVKRLEARPVAEYSLEGQEKHEKSEKLYRE